MLRIIFLYFITLYLFGCKDKLLYEDQFGKKVDILYDSLISLNHLTLERNKQSKKVVTILSMNCPSCIDEVNHWNTLINKYKEFRNVTLIVILKGEFSEYTYYHLIKKNKYNFPIYWDKHNETLANNDIGYIEFEKSILLSKVNTILYIGSPLQDRKVLHKYKNLIKNNL